MKIADVRRSQLVTTFGVGSMYPAQDQSLMIRGLDDWYPRFCRAVTEPRLARSLGVRELREPPTGLDVGDVPVIRFPEYYFCPECHRLDSIGAFDSTGKTPRCQYCGRTIVPSRFVVCCINGHIDDFPYQRWVHQGSPATGDHNLKLTTRGESSALRDIEISCSCGARRSMDGAFGPSALRGVAVCSRRRPWLGDVDDQPCSESPRTLQRGSANTWFGQVRSSISIPPWSEVYGKLEKHREVLQGVGDDRLRDFFDTEYWIPKGSGLTADRWVSLYRELSGGSSSVVPTEASMRNDEYQALMDGHVEKQPSDQFVCTKVAIEDTQIARYVAEVRNVSRLREVRALTGFSRVVPSDRQTSPLSKELVDWLPAIEVFGEGVFLELSTAHLREWVNGPLAAERTSMILNSAGRMAHAPAVDAKLLLIHTFAHALMNELSLDAGYPVASLRERLYVDGSRAGVLVYTSTSDSAGSLGGLSSQSASSQLSNIIRSAIARAQWCSTDPICIESGGSGTDNLNLAACHACMLVPETSCELRNTLLDRGLLVGIPDRETEGFFSDLL